MTAAVGIAQSGTNSVSWRNRIINGGMVLDQRNAGASVTPTTANTTYAVDRFVFLVSQATKLTAQRSTVAPAGFTNSLLVTSSSAYSVLTNDFFGVKQAIEGFNVADLGWGAAGAQTVTLSFWVRSSLTGSFGGSLYNSAGNRVYPFTYTISAANTFEYKSITVAGDTTGTWLTDNGIGLQVFFSLGAGSGQTGTAGAWGTSGFGGPPGSTSLVGTNGATFYITGVQLEQGTAASPFEYRDYGRELMMCQRYYAKMGSTVSTGACGSGVARSSTASNVFIKLPVTMRAIPTVSYSNVFLNYGSDTYQSVTGNSGVQGGTDSLNYFPNASGASMTTGAAVVFAIGNGGYVDFSSEL